MNTTAQDPLLTDYLRELEHAARGLPRAQRAELLAEIDSIKDPAGANAHAQ